ncbi:MAG TPA: ATP-binding protein [Burkholderiales bacterium]|nr:ATP-binding protein [Burkholderiales bacterium]
MKWLGRTRTDAGRSEPDARTGERSLVWLRLAVILAALVPLLFFAGAARLGYVDAVRATSTRLDELARAAEDHAARTLERNDLVMQQMLQLLKEDDDEALRKREAQLHEVATAILLRLPHIGSLSVKNERGDVLMSTFFPPASRTLAGPDWKLLADRANDEVMLTVAKRRSLSSGAPGGVVELTLNRSYFDEFYRRLTEGDSHLTAALLNGEGVLVASWPPVPLSDTRLAHGPLVKRIKAGEAHGTLLESGVLAASGHRYAAFRKVGDEPLYVAVTQDMASALADWKHQMLILGAVLLPITLALVGASWLALRRTRRELEARRRLQDEAQQRELAEDALRQAQKLDALGQLAGGLAHDFNNLLMVVSANAELLGRAVPQAATRPELNSILRAVDGGSKLTRRLLGFSRKRAHHPEVVRPQAALDGMLDLLRTTAGKAVEITLQVDAQTPPIDVDVAELEMALINLVANARDAMGHKGRIRIQARPGRPGEGSEGSLLGYAVISVSDTGHGMSADILNRAFEPFFTTKPPGVGTGLGLAQVYGFCAQAGGDVEVASKLRVGTTVSMLIPATTKVARPAQREATGVSRLSARVLLVEDSPELCSSIAASLERSGCVVTPVSSAVEAERLALAPDNGFDVVLSDIVMPGGDGVALAARLRKRRPELPVVLITGYSREVRHAVGPDMEILAKPCAAEEIVGALSRAISAHRPASPMH